MSRYHVVKIANDSTEPTRICIRTPDRSSAEYAAEQYNTRLGQPGYYYTIIEAA